MSLNIQKLRELHKGIERKEQEEKMSRYILASEQIGEYLEFEKTRKKVEQSARVLNNWAQQGLIDPPDEGKKRTYNKLEGVWIDLVTQLREFGLGLDKIKAIRIELFGKKNNDNSKFSPIKYAILYSLMIEPYIVMVYADGTINMMPKSKYIEYLGDEFILPLHLSINMLVTSQKEFPQNNFTELVNDGDITLLTEKELELLYYLRTGDYDEIKVRMDKGDTYLIEGSKKLNADTKVVDIINNYAYQDIEIKVRDGKTVLIKSTELKK